MRRLRIATRGSDLALTQARSVARRIELTQGAEVELVTLKTTGDRLQDVSLAKLGGKGLFVKEIEEALLDGSADLAVHSAKDLPAETPPGLALVAFPERADPRDALVGRERGTTLGGLRRGARVGTGSVRRTAQLLALRPDLEVVGLRGNVPTRLRKLEEQELDAVVLACAGLDRLGLAARIDERIAPELLLPAVAQGVLALEARADHDLSEVFHALNDPQAWQAAEAERAFLAALGGDCNTPLAALSRPAAGGRISLEGLVASHDGLRIVRGRVEAEGAAEAGVRLAEALLAQGAAEILEAERRGALG